MAKPMKFPEMNTIFAETQPEYTSLPTVREPDGCVTSCWKLTWLERIKLLFTGKVWVQQLTFSMALQPLRVAVDKPIFKLASDNRPPLI